ncbi:MAG: M23 family metallopeptidase [Curtobacterium sp.]
MTTLRDADQHPGTPVVHTSRRAALEAERAAAKAKPPRPVKPAKSVGPSKPAKPTSRFTRVPRRSVATTKPPLTTKQRTSRLTVTSALAAIVMFAASAMPAHASPTTSTATTTLAPTVRTQDFAVTQAVATATTNRDGFTVGGSGGATAGAEVTFGGDVRSPFPKPVRMSSGFGYRSAPCGACSSLHQGLDFNPGMGAPIGAVAAGTVRVSGTYFSYGNAVIIDHVVDGREVSTLYGHMIPGSSPLQVGDEVTAGQFVGLVGSSGVSTGAHLHLEVLMDGTLPVDPRAWIESHTGRSL